MRSRPALRLAVGLLLIGATPAGAQVPELLYLSEGNRLWRYDIDSLDRNERLVELVFQNAETDPVGGRDINGMICALPGDAGLLVAGEDTGQPHPPAGFGVLAPHGVQVGKLTPSAFSDYPDPYGCVVDAAGRLFTSETGRQFFGGGNGQLLLWFPPFARFPGPRGAYPRSDATSTDYCKLATDLGTALGLAVDPEGRVYVAAASGMEVVRFWPPFPSGADAAGGCGARDALGSPLADSVRRERFLGPLFRLGLITYSGLAFAPHGNLYVASVASGRIGEFDTDGNLVRMILDPENMLPPYATGYPQGLAVDSRGTLYYTDLDLERHGFDVDTGPDGRLWRIRFDFAGRPLAPQLLARGLGFPDGLGVVPGDLDAALALGSTRVQRAPIPEPLTAQDGEGGAALLVLLAVVFVTGAALWLALWRRRGRLDL